MLNRVPYTYLKWAFREIPDFDNLPTNFLERVTYFSMTGNDHSGRERKLEMFPELVRWVHEIANDKLGIIEIKTVDRV